MRPTRILAALVALLLAAALPLVSSGAQAVTDDHSAKAAKTKVTIKFKPNGAKNFTLYGKITPKSKGKNKKVTLLRSSSANGNYKKFKTTKANKKGKYSFNGLKKEGYYAAKVGNTTSGVKHICKGSCG